MDERRGTLFRGTFDIQVNSLLRGTEKEVPLPDLLQLREAAGKREQPGNLATVEEDEVDQIHEFYGPAGLFSLLALAFGHSRAVFDHFFEVERSWLRLRRVLSSREDWAPQGLQLELDNTDVPATDLVDRFKSNLLMPSLSRKFYRPGRHEGSLVYGLGGPRILVSHPFRGRSQFEYDVDRNSLDVVTHLLWFGYWGQFQFLDWLPALEHDICGVPGWAARFSQIASQSDLVLFIKEFDGEFGPAQALEIALTPDRVHKKVIEIPSEELTWAKGLSELDEVDARIVIEPGGGILSYEEHEQQRAKSAGTMVEVYPREGMTGDALIHLDEQHNARTFPLDHDSYRPWKNKWTVAEWE